MRSRSPSLLPFARRFAGEQLERRDLLSSISLFPQQDATLYQDDLGELANGAGAHLFAGATAQSEGERARRGLIAFDPVGQIPEGAVLDRVTLTMTVSKTNADVEPISLHRVLGDWGEGNSDAPTEEGGGDLATSDSATWVYRRFEDEVWDAPGGDFSPGISGITLVGGVGVYSWSTRSMLQDVEDWLADPQQNFGWLLLGNEATDRTVKRFDSRENPVEENRPRLTIEFTEPPVIPTLTVGAPSVDEGDAGITTIEFPITLSDPPAETVRLQVATRSGSAAEGVDYLPTVESVSFAPGDPLTKSVAVEIVGDVVTEADETFHLDLSNVVGAVAAVTTVEGTIVNDDPEPTLVVVPPSIVEGDFNTSTAIVTVELSHPSDFAISADYATLNDTAEANLDYLGTSGTLTFPARTTSQSFAVEIIGDAELETDETFLVRLSNPVNARVDLATAIIILDNDGPAPDKFWHNASFPEDVTGDGLLVPRDALIIINWLNNEGSGPLPPPSESDGPPPFLDVNGDNQASPIDALRVINLLNNQSP